MVVEEIVASRCAAKVRKSMLRMNFFRCVLLCLVLASLIGGGIICAFSPPTIYRRAPASPPPQPPLLPPRGYPAPPRGPHCRSRRACETAGAQDGPAALLVFTSSLVRVTPLPPHPTPPPYLTPIASRSAHCGPKTWPLRTPPRLAGSARAWRWEERAAML